MKKVLIIIAIVILSVSFLLILKSCGNNTLEKPVLANSAVIHEPEFGGVYITKTIDEFNALGFKYGDSVNVKFSNGYKLENIPYYNGYYTQNGEPLLIAYPGYDYIKAATAVKAQQSLLRRKYRLPYAIIRDAEHGRTEGRDR